MQIVFGPVYSRRFGLSLGVDLSPQLKQCNFDCLYCELAPAATVAEQIKVIPLKEIIDEIEKHLNDTIDVITLTANGEPTLYPYFDALVAQLAKMKGKTKTLVLSNSSHLDDRAVFHSLLQLDKVKLSLDAVSQKVFKKLDRPHSGIKIETILQKLQEFSEIYTGELYIEILFVKGLNDTQEEITLLNEVLKNLKKVTRIDIGTIDRPPAYPVEGVRYEKLYAIASLFDRKLPIHIVTRKKHTAKKLSLNEETLLNTLDKRPLTLEDIEELYDEKSIKTFKKLLKEGKISKKKNGLLTFYLPKENLYRKRVKIS